MSAAPWVIGYLLLFGMRRKVSHYPKEAVGVVYVKPEDRVRYLQAHADEFFGKFPKKDSLNHRDKKLVPEMQAHWIQLVKTGRSSTVASQMTISTYFHHRGLGRTDVANAFKFWGTIDDRIKAEAGE